MIDDKIFWPFRGPKYQTNSGPIQTYYFDAQSRIDHVLFMENRKILDAALAIPGLQKTVAAAIKRRIKQIDIK